MAIHSVRASAWVMERERGGYYELCTLGVRIEFRASGGEAAGVRWTIDGWADYRDTPAAHEQTQAPAGSIWRAEIGPVAVAGWRDGSIGGPHGEQPSATQWRIWGKNRLTARCLPLDSPPPLFEFAVYARHGREVAWNNNQGGNFKLCLFDPI